MNAAFGLRFTLAFGFAAAFLGLDALFAFGLDFDFDLAFAGAFFFAFLVAMFKMV